MLAVKAPVVFIALVLLLALLAPIGASAGAETKAPLIDWSSYPTYDEYTSYLLSLNSSYPELIKVFSIGKSVENRDIWCCIVANFNKVGNRPIVYVDGVHHGDEKISLMVPLYLIDHLVTNYSTDSYVRKLVDSTVLIVTPCLNPDGYEANTRENANGADLNRDYDGPNPGYTPFSEPETRANRKVFYCADEDLRLWISRLGITVYKFVAYVTFHAGIEVILHPWGYDYDTYPADLGIIRGITHNVSYACTYPYDYYASWELYPVRGAADDYGFWLTGAPTWTWEISSDKSPANILYYCERCLPGLLHIMEHAKEWTWIEVDVSVSPENPTSGSEAYVTVTVKNQGLRPYWNVLAYLCADSSNVVLLSQNETRLGLGSIFLNDTVESGNIGWTATGGWSISSADAHSGSYCWYSGPYDNNVDWTLTSPSVSLEDADKASLVFYYKCDMESGYDYVYVEVSTDGGATWERLYNFTGEGYTSRWMLKAIDLSDYCGQTIQVRFRLHSDHSVTAGGFYLDDVLIAENSIRPGEEVSHTWTVRFQKAGRYNLKVVLSGEELRTWYNSTEVEVAPVIPEVSSSAVLLAPIAGTAIAVALLSLKLSRELEEL